MILLRTIGPTKSARRLGVAVALLAVLGGCGQGTGPGAASVPPPASSTPSQAAGGPALTTEPAATIATPAASTGGVLTVATTKLRLPTPLSRAAVIPDGSAILVAGGFTGSGTTAAILRLAPGTGRVTRIGSLPAPVHDAAGAALGGSFLVLGGGRTVAEAIVQRVTPDGSARSVGRLPGPRADLGAATIGTQVIVVGGWSGVGPDRRVLATTDGIHFRTIATLPVGVRYPAVAVLGGLLYVVGGTGTGGEVRTIQVVDGATGRARVAGLLPRSLTEATAVVLGGRLFVIGGRHAGRPLDTILELHPGGLAVTIAGRLPRPLADASAVVVAGTGYVVGGEEATPVDTVISLAIR